MKFFASLTLTAKLAWSFAIGSVLTIALAIASSFALSHISGDLRTVVTNRVSVVVLLAQAKDNGNTVNSSMRNLLLTDSKADRDREIALMNDLRTSNTAIAEQLEIFEAWSDEPWVVDGAGVRVSVVCYHVNGSERVSLDGKEEPSKRTILYHFGRLLDLAGINREGRDIVPYSFRHYYITERIMSGLGYHEVAAICGTSAGEVEETYYHLNDQTRLTLALAGYEIDDAGLVVPVEE